MAFKKKDENINRSGRKPGALSIRTKLIRELITDLDGDEAIQKVKDLAFNIDGTTHPMIQAKMLELLLAYKYGKPQQSIDLTSGEEKIDTIQVVMISNESKG
jgi:hypothetical protein